MRYIDTSFLTVFLLLIVTVEDLVEKPVTPAAKLLLAWSSVGLVFGSLWLATDWLASAGVLLLR